MANLLNVIKTNRVDSQVNTSERRETNWYTVEMDSAEFDVNDILLNQQIPQFFEDHPTNPVLFVVDYDFKKIEDVPNAAELGVIYSNRFENKTDDYIQNPLLRPADITWHTYKTREPFLKDLDDKTVATTAGEPLPLEEEVSRRVIRIQKNIDKIKPIFAKEIDFVNSDYVKIQGISFDPETLLLTDLTIGSVAFENKIRYYPLAFALYFKPDGWRRKLRNAGFIERAAYGYVSYPFQAKGDGSLIAIKIGKPKAFPTSPVPLDEYGFAFRKQDPATGKWNIVGSVDSANNVIGMDAADWERTILKFRTRKLLKFTNNIPLK